MGMERCPSCAAAVRKDAEWCTLCYADLRPAPAPAARAAYPQPSATVYSAASAVAPSLGFAPAAAATDALHAPYEHVLAAVYGAGPATSQPPPVGAAPLAAPETRTGWPCSQCGELNDFEKVSCVVCGSGFGAALRSDSPVVDRKKMTMYAIGAALTFLLLVAALTFAATKRPPGDPGNTNVSSTVETTVPEPPVAVPPAVLPGSVPPVDPAAPAPASAPAQ